MEKAVVFFFEEDSALPEGGIPLFLEHVRERPVLFWAAEALLRGGAERFFAAASPRYEADIRACFPSGTDVTVSEMHADLMAFLDTDEPVAVIPRSALPMSEAGVGRVYSAPGRSLRTVWQTKMTNSIQDAVLLPGWIPLFSRETLAELAPHFHPDSPGM